MNVLKNNLENIFNNPENQTQISIYKQNSKKSQNSIFYMMFIFISLLPLAIQQPVLKHCSLVSIPPFCQVSFPLLNVTQVLGMKLPTLEGINQCVQIKKSLGGGVLGCHLASGDKQNPTSQLCYFRAVRSEKSISASVQCRRSGEVEVIFNSNALWFLREERAFPYSLQKIRFCLLPRISRISHQICPKQYSPEWLIKQGF